MKSKKGISVAISWILLIGLTVTLALIVTIWMKAFSEKAAEGVKETVENDIRCSEISLTATNTSSCSNLELSITNKGYFTIDKIRIRGDTGTDVFEIPIKPMETKTLNTQMDYSSSSEIGIIPISKIENKEIVCPDREIIIAC